ncbi:MAG: OmpH family outer membrane protein [Bacteroidetes bacterium]|nr:OmpH family outer membrane protein [Bacteroidota bacterium]
MKKILSVLAIATLFMGSASAQKIAYLNMQTVLDTLPETDSVREQLYKYAGKLQLDLTDLAGEIDKAKAAYDAINADPSTSQVRKELLAKRYQTLVEEYQRTEQDAQKQLMDKEKEKMQPVYDLIKKSAGYVGKSKGYILVLNNMVLNNTGGMVLYNLNDADDITAAVIKHMLAKYPVPPKPAGSK